jgi:hypothetical protein
MKVSALPLTNHMAVAVHVENISYQVQDAVNECDEILLNPEIKQNEKLFITNTKTLVQNVITVMKNSNEILKSGHIQTFINYKCLEYTDDLVSSIELPVEFDEFMKGSDELLVFNLAKLENLVLDCVNSQIMDQMQHLKVNGK